MKNDTTAASHRNQTDGIIEIRPVAWFRSPFTSKFGIPRQSGIADDVEGEVVFCPPYDSPDAVRGMEGFSHLWLVWGFSANRGAGGCGGSDGQEGSGGGQSRRPLTVRPPRLGGNERIGVFASRSPFRPNGMGLSCVRLKRVGDGRITVSGADLMDGTPIYDVKPYIAYADSRPDAVCGFTDSNRWEPLDVIFPGSMRKPFTADEASAIISALSQDPRPRYHHDAHRIYGMPFAGHDIRFRVADGTVTVTEVV